MNGLVTTAPSGARGFDCNAPVSPADAKAFANDGYTFVMRYAPRITPHTNDVSAGEIDGLLAAGIAVGVVQHYGPKDGWIPTPELGVSYGREAAAFCAQLGLPQGTGVWLDLEGIGSSVPSDVVIEYANNWYIEVERGGYVAGLYVGVGNRLTPGQLYNLAFQRYWGALNLNRDQFPAIRGLCMKQHEAKPADRPHGIAYAIDTDTVMPDTRGGLPAFCAPPGWTGL